MFVIVIDIDTALNDPESLKIQKTTFSVPQGFVSNNLFTVFLKILNVFINYLVDIMLITAGYKIS